MTYAKKVDTTKKLRLLKLPKKISLKKECDMLWAQLVKAKAGYKSELSGKEGKQIGGDSILHAHHIMRKPNMRLRYDPSNGMCLTAGEHKFGVHGANAVEYQDKIIAKVGIEHWEHLKSLRRGSKGSQVLILTKIYLEQELQKLQRG